ncbi:MAG: ribonuclease H-like domain-containing protein [Bacillota bacterium]
MGSATQQNECGGFDGCYRVVRSFPLDSPIAEPRKQDILQNLTLTRGIGLYRQSRLKERGFTDLVKLTEHPTWSQRAAEVVRAIEERDYATLALSGASYSELLSFFSFSDIAVLDIETLGLRFNFPIILVGVLSLSEDGYKTRQYLATDYHLEAAMLKEAMSDLSSFSVVVTYNGKAFDVPYLNYRADSLGVGRTLNQVNLDLLHHVRKHYGEELPDCRLTTIEQHILGSTRGEDIPAGGVPLAFSRYLETGDMGYLQPVIDHNLFDLQSLFHLFLLSLDDM